MGPLVLQPAEGARVGAFPSSCPFSSSRRACRYDAAPGSRCYSPSAPRTRRAGDSRGAARRPNCTSQRILGELRRGLVHDFHLHPRARVLGPSRDGSICHGVAVSDCVPLASRQLFPPSM